MVQTSAWAGPKRQGAFVSGMERWRRATLDGNGAFERGDLAGALERYREAAELAAEMMGGDADPGSATAAFVVSHHNLAQLCERRERPGEAGEHLAHVLETLHRAMADAGLARPWREAAWRHSRIAYAELLAFLRRHPDHPRALRAADLPAFPPGAARSH